MADPRRGTEMRQPLRELDFVRNVDASIQRITSQDPQPTHRQFNSTKLYLTCPEEWLCDGRDDGNQTVLTSADGAAKLGCCVCRTTLYSRS
jgi:hypothetical protein